MQTITELGPQLGIVPTCAALGLPKATCYRALKPKPPPQKKTSHRALDADERRAVLVRHAARCRTAVTRSRRSTVYPFAIAAFPTPGQDKIRTAGSHQVSGAVTVAVSARGDARLSGADHRARLPTNRDRAAIQPSPSRPPRRAR
jgi:hypothetical protein